MPKLAAFARSFWIVARASAEYVAGRIGEDEWHARVGIARLAVGKEPPDWPDRGAAENGP